MVFRGSLSKHPVSLGQYLDWVPLLPVCVCVCVSSSGVYCTLCKLNMYMYRVHLKGKSRRLYWLIRSALR